MITYCQRDYVNFCFCFFFFVFFFFFCPLAVCVSALLLYALKKKRKRKKKRKKEKRFSTVVKLFGSPSWVRLYKSLVMCIFFFHGRHMSLSTAFFVFPCLILFCIICSICKWKNK